MHLLLVASLLQVAMKLVTSRSSSSHPKTFQPSQTLTTSGLTARRPTRTDRARACIGVDHQPTLATALCMWRQGH